MRNLFIILLTLICVVSFNLYANGQTGGGAGAPADTPTEGVNDELLIQFSDVPDPGNVDGITPDDMSQGNWRVWQNASATMPTTLRESFTRGVDGKLGVKISFPYMSYVSHAYIEPRYCINPFDKDGKAINTKKGVIRNVGTLKEIKCNVAGRGFKVGLGVRLRNERNEIIEYFLGTLDFVGWKELSWKNPDYTPRVDPKRVAIHPVYPLHDPYLVFDSFVIHRYDGGYGGDFVVYFKDVKVSYDVAIPKSIYDKLEEKDDEIWKSHQNLYKARNAHLRDKVETMKKYEMNAIERKGKNYQKDTEFPKDEEAPASGTK